MSNKPKGFAIHNNNIFEPVVERYNRFIAACKKFANNRHYYGKHVGSKPLRVLKQYK